MIEVPTVYGNTITLYFNYQESISDSCPSLMCFITFYYKKHTTGRNFNESEIFRQTFT